MASNFKISELKCSFYYTIALGHFIEKSSSKINSFNFLYDFGDIIFSNILNQIEVKKLRFLMDYQFDRGAYNIINTLGLDDELKSFVWENPLSFGTEFLSVKSDGFTLSKNATISLRFDVLGTDIFEIEKLIGELTKVRKDIKSNLRSYFLKAINQLEAYPLFPQFFEINCSSELINQWVKSFEIIDFNFADGSKQGSEVLKEYFESSADNIPPELVGFLRMTRPGVWDNYRKEYQKKFWQNNLGNRNDELWIIHVKHFFRYHPERESIHSVKSFFNEVQVAMEILNHKVSFIEYLNNIMDHVKLTQFKGLKKTLQLTEKLTDKSPMLPEYSPHDFFSILMLKYLEEFNYVQMIENYRKLLSEIQTVILSYSSLLSSRRMNFLTWLIFFFTATQIFLLLFEVEKIDLGFFTLNSKQILIYSLSLIILLIIIVLLFYKFIKGKFIERIRMIVFFNKYLIKKFKKLLRILISKSNKKEEEKD